MKKKPLKIEFFKSLIENSIYVCFLFDNSSLDFWIYLNNNSQKFSKFKKTPYNNFKSDYDYLVEMYKYHEKVTKEEAYSLFICLEKKVKEELNNEFYIPKWKQVDWTL